MQPLWHNNQSIKKVKAFSQGYFIYINHPINRSTNQSSPFIHQSIQIDQLTSTKQYLFLPHLSTRNLPWINLPPTPSCQPSPRSPSSFVTLRLLTYTPPASICLLTSFLLLVAPASTNRSAIYCIWEIFYLGMVSTEVGSVAFLCQKSWVMYQTLRERSYSWVSVKKSRSKCWQVPSRLTTYQARIYWPLLLYFDNSCQASIRLISCSEKKVNIDRYLSKSSSAVLYRYWQISFNGVFSALRNNALPSDLPNLAPDLVNSKGIVTAQASFPSLFFTNSVPFRIFPHWSLPPICSTHPLCSYNWLKSYPCMRLQANYAKERPSSLYRRLATIYLASKGPIRKFLPMLRRNSMKFMLRQNSQLFINQKG